MPNVLRWQALPVKPSKQLQVPLDLSHRPLPEHSA
jgi:hypothetical protein